MGRADEQVFQENSGSGIFGDVRAEMEVPFLITGLRCWRCGVKCGRSKRDMIRTMIGWKSVIYRETASVTSGSN